MKFSHLLLAAGLFSFGTASAQTTPGTTVPSTPGQSGTASPSTQPSGMAAPTPNPKGNVSPGEVFTTGDPNSTQSGGKAMKRKKMKAKM